MSRVPFTPSQPPSLLFVNELLERRPLLKVNYSTKGGKTGGLATSAAKSDWIDKFVESRGVMSSLGDVLRKRREEEGARRKTLWEERENELEKKENASPNKKK